MLQFNFLVYGDNMQQNYAVGLINEAVAIKLTMNEWMNKWMNERMNVLFPCDQKLAESKYSYTHVN